MSLLRHLPNALTLCNLICGCIGVILLSEHGDREVIFVLVAIACVFDFLDGFAARMLKVSSPIGKELDSLADMVTFGVLPSLFILTYEDTKWIALLIVVCSALRLAKFNVDERQADGFIGLPTPASALFFTSCPFWLLSDDPEVRRIIVIVIILLFSWLMVSPIRLFALKFKHFGWKGNELRFTFLAFSVLLIALFKLAGVALIIITYILASLFDGWRRAGTVHK